MAPPAPNPDRAISVADHRQALIAVVSIAAILSLDHYRDLLPLPILDDLLLYLAVPLFIIILLFRRNPLDFGLRAGRWRAGLAWTAVGVVLMAGVAWLFLHTPGFRPYYTGYFAIRNPDGDLWTGIAQSGIQMFGWEFLFRGFLLFALARVFGPAAIWLQMVPFALAHFGKPELETYLSIPGGLLAGWIAYRANAFWPAWLTHWALAILMYVLVGSL